jgi:hypothetical protein
MLKHRPIMKSDPPKGGPVQTFIMVWLAAALLIAGIVLIARALY